MRLGEIERYIISYDPCDVTFFVRHKGCKTRPNSAAVLSDILDPFILHKADVSAHLFSIISFVSHLFCLFVRPADFLHRFIVISCASLPWVYRIIGDPPCNLVNFMSSHRIIDENCQDQESEEERLRTDWSERPVSYKIVRKWHRFAFRYFRFGLCSIILYYKHISHSGVNSSWGWPFYAQVSARDPMTELAETSPEKSE